MSFYSLFFIAVALSLDAFGVALCIGLNNIIRFKNKLLFACSFGFFQFLFSFLGAYAGFFFNRYIVSVPEIIGGILIALVGILMIKEGFENNGKCPYLKPGMTLILGISVSIDAMVIGFTALDNISSNIIILYDTIFIGIVTFVISCIGFYMARYLKKISVVGKYADYIGGIILLIFGLKMMFL